MVDFVWATQAISGFNVTTNDGPDGRSISVKAAMDSPGDSGDLASFEVYDASTKDGDKIALSIGTILLSHIIDDKLTITGLGDPTADPDLGAFELPKVGELIWIHVTVSGLVATAATRQSGAPDWEDDPIERDGDGNQTGFNLVVAEVVDASDERSGLDVGDVKILQKVDQSQMTLIRTLDGKAALVLVPCGVSTGA